MDKTVALDNVRKEIENRKRKKQNVAHNLGEKSSTNDLLPKDSFLNELYNSLETGRITNSTERIKMVENKMSNNLGEKPNHVIVNDDVEVKNPIPKRIPKPVDNGGEIERTSLLYEELERKQKELLSKQYNNTNPQQLNTNPETLHLNEEHVKQIVTENLTHIVEHAMKNTIVEIYAAERMKDILNENKDVIREVVIDTIRELQKKKKR